MHIFKKFARDEKGSVFVMITLCMVMMIGIVGAAVDYARASLLKSELSSALDSAALAGGTVANSANFNSTVQKYFNVNLPAGYMGATIDPLNVVLSTNKDLITISATAHLNNSLLKVVGWNMANVSASTEVTVEKKAMELVLVMDNTGSMAGTSMTNMKAAAQSLLDIMYAGKETIPDFYVGLVPYASSVNIGSSRTSWLTGYTASNYSPTTWKGCVNSRGANEATELTPEAGGLWTPLFWETSDDNEWKCATNDSTCITKLNNAADHSTCGAAAGRITACTGAKCNINENECAGNLGSGPNLGCGPAITSLTPSYTEAKNAIAAMDAWSRGGTMSDLGMAWGWRMISPNYQGRWGGSTPNTLPLAYHTPLMDKVVILLTDGENQFYDYKGDGLVNGSDRTGNGRLGEGLMGSTNSTNATNNINTRLTNICTAMKNQGIIIYTITFTNSVNNNIRSIYQGCASKPEYYFDSPTSADLNTAFTSIGDSLSNLRISK